MYGLQNFQIYKIIKKNVNFASRKNNYTNLKTFRAKNGTEISDFLSAKNTHTYIDLLNIKPQETLEFEQREEKESFYLR